MSLTLDWPWIGAATATHAVLILSLLAYLHHQIDAVVLVDIQIFNAAVPLATVLVIHRIRDRGGPMPCSK